MSLLESAADAASNSIGIFFEGALQRHPEPVRDARTARTLNEKTIAAAEEAMLGMLVLPGTLAKPRFVGQPPDWFANPVGDREYTWTLNRMEHWTALLRAWLLTGDRRYSDRVVLELRDWLHRCRCPEIDPSQAGQRFHDGLPIGSIRTMGQLLRRWPSAYRTSRGLRKIVRRLRPSGPRAAAAPLGSTPYNTLPWRSLEAGVRMVHLWPMLKKYLPKIAPEDCELSAQLVCSAREHGRVLATISPLLWPNADHNHYLMECLGLLSASINFGDLPEANQWKIQAMSELERCARAQFTPDGGHIEGCPHYHNICVYLLARAVCIAEGAGLRFSDETKGTLSRSLDHCLHALRPDGTGVPAGDSDADQLAVHATLFGYLATGDIGPLQGVTRLTDPDALISCIREYPDCVDDPEDLIDRCTRSAPAAAPLISWQRQLKQATLRTSWNREAISVFFSCRSPIYNGHAHADPASFDLTALGRPILVDPGRLTYVDNADRRAIKSAAWHNTITIDHREPFEYLAAMHFARQQHGTITGVVQQPNLLAAEAFHLNYRPAVHRRLIAILEQRMVLVMDRIDHVRPRSRVQLHYHLNYGHVNFNRDRQAVTAHGSDVDLTLFTTEGLTGSQRRGKISPKIGLAIDSIRLEFEDSPGKSHRRHATLIVPRKAGAVQPLVKEFKITRHDDAITCSFILDDCRFAVDWTPATASEAEPIVTLTQTR